MTGGVRKRGDNWYYYFDLRLTVKERRLKGRAVKPRRSWSSFKKALQNMKMLVCSLNQVKYLLQITWIIGWRYVEMNCKYNTIDGYKIVRIYKACSGSWKLKSVTPAVLQQYVNEKSARFHQALPGEYDFSAFRFIQSSSFPLQVYKRKSYAICKASQEWKHESWNWQESYNPEWIQTDYWKIPPGQFLLYPITNCLSYWNKSWWMLCFGLG